ncbi:AMP-dependent synthetase/ligase [Bacteroides intestinalis]|uniref:Long-chain fatty acid--CoA ligase n=1 Tax=Bacteroides intestinalis TaxID=329854 RepID=A0A4Q5HFB3_9BACE|nr:AMP-dependent synthetase/ligase [Bacteroides intestinalis]KAA4692406.1 long-chain fatty acid--CoA ligase [Bacteroides intestinalis]KAA4718195.1 long-chain fatty acid--CoA ligase [Bacteroides intestinalis]MCB6678074.1 AMP-dependent synthetase/ligase [Bacteroides intestinalis]MCB7015623.1 AMP-dependent synthetase/ligase [Bacteroides intestinalis]MCG4702755.1 AMP-dependent synthetase/ligase [Bacteroides intestinalis]
MTYHHLSVLVHRRAEKYGDKVALKYRDYETSQWIPITWNQFSQTVRQVANALVELGVQEEENIGIFSQNKPECLYVDFGAFANRAVTIPLYATSSPAQAQYIINDAQIRYIFVGEQFQYDAAFSVFGFCQSLQQLIIFDRAVVRDPRDMTSIYFDEFLETGKGLPNNDIVEERTSRASDDDLANILYTSGTTGEPKGVMLHHSNYMEAFRIHDIRLVDMSDQDISMNFLPLTHVFEKAWTYLCIHKGVQICINLRPVDIQTTIKEIRPTLMCSVPRFWEKVYAGVQEKIAQETGLKKAMMLDAIKVGKIHNIDYLRKGKTPPLMLHLKYKFYEKTVYALLKKTIGIENGNFFPTAGAAVPDEICEFVHSVGINMLVGYGLTESTATVSCFLNQGYEIGSVGTVMPDVEVKIGEENEILLRGKTITKGYYKKAEATAATIDKDGWFHTGDAGYLKGDQLYLTERIKDLFKTSNGKYVSPQALETKLAIDRYIDQIAIIADQRKFVSALIVPVYGFVKDYAKEKGIEYKDMEELLQHPKILGLFRARIDTLQQQFAHYEQVKRFTLLPEPFSMERGELTNTLKLKRPVVAKNYKEVIDKMYEE